jgi:hypothetical protein
MTPDDAHTSHNHGFELPDAPLVVVQNEPRPWRAVAGVALCLGLAGVVTGLVVANRQRNSDARITSDALQREELRDGWKALGAAAAQDARNNDVQAAPAAAAPAAAATAAPNVVIVNVPAQSAAAAPPSAAPSNVTNINLPNGAVAPGTPIAGSNTNSGLAQTQSMPPINYSPLLGLPTQAGTTSAPASGTSQPQGYTPPPNVVYGAPPGGTAPYTPPVGNGSIPGSTPNPALPNNNGLVGSTPTPGQPNGSVNGGANPSTPIGAVPTSPGTPSLPSGFSAP